MSFVEGLASSLQNLPQAIRYRQDRQREEAYDKDITGLSSADGPFDPVAAARIAQKYGDHRGAREYRRAGADASARAADAERQQKLDAIKAEDRARRMATEDEATATSQLKSFAGRFVPHFEAGDTNAMGRMIAKHPGLFGKLMNHGPDRRVVGIEGVQTPAGETRYAFQLKNSRTDSTGPETKNATGEPDDNVVSYSRRRSRAGCSRSASGEGRQADQRSGARVRQGA